jgi:hypothetical protein
MQSQRWTVMLDEVSMVIGWIGSKSSCCQKWFVNLATKHLLHGHFDSQTQEKDIACFEENMYAYNRLKE